MISKRPSASHDFHARLGADLQSKLDHITDDGFGRRDDEIDTNGATLFLALDAFGAPGKAAHRENQHDEQDPDRGLRH
jgi:hypothetical protein